MEDSSILSELKGVSDLLGSEGMGDQNSTKPSAKDGQSTLSAPDKSAHSKVRLTEVQKKQLYLLMEVIRRRLAESEEMPSAKCL